MWSSSEYVCKVNIRSKLNYFVLINQKLDVKRRILFRDTCFGQWLDLLLFDHEPLLIDYMIRRQHEVDYEQHDMPLIYYLDGHTLHFGRREFSLVTGFRFGNVSFNEYTYGELNFRNRVFPNKIGLPITNLDLIGVIEDQEMFDKLDDVDATRVCLLLVLEVIFMGRVLTSKVDDSLFSLVENLEAWNSFPWGEHMWCHLYDEIKNIKHKHSDEHYYGLKNDRKYVPTYSLSGFVLAFQIWILETFEKCKLWWLKDPTVIPRALAWTKKSLFTISDYSCLFSKESRSTPDIRPTEAEFQCSWWINNNLFIDQHVPSRPPLTEHHGMFQTYLLKLEKSRNLGKICDMISSIQSTSDNVQGKKYLKDKVISELNFRVFKLETIIQVLSHERNERDSNLQFSDAFSQLTSELRESLNTMYFDLVRQQENDEDVTLDYLREEELRMFLEDEERVRREHENMIARQNKLRLSHAKKLRLEEEKLLQLEKEKVTKRKEFMKTSHARKCLSKLPASKRPHLVACAENQHPKISFVKIKRTRDHESDPFTAELLNTVKPWVEDISRVIHSIDKVWLSDDIRCFLAQPGQHKFNFPWNADYTVDRRFWLKLVCLDPARKGWLTEEHIDLWVDYMWHVRPEKSNWAMVSCYFVQILLQKGTPIFYVNGERYKTAWLDVEQVFIPINETDKHWCLAQFHILSGDVTFYDTGCTYDYEYRDWYVKIRQCLQVNLPVILQRANIFEKKGIDPMTYTINFRLAEGVPKQGGLYGDCGVWVCILLYRLAHGLCLDVDDPVDVALAYREKMVRFYFKHKY